MRRWRGLWRYFVDRSPHVRHARIGERRFDRANFNSACQRRVRIAPIARQIRRCRIRLNLCSSRQRQRQKQPARQDHSHTRHSQ